MRLILLAILLLCVPCAPAQEPAEQVRFDFETGDMQGWEIVEGQFDYFVSDRPFFHNIRDTPYNKQGTYYLSSVEQQPGMPSNDRMTGVAESPVFLLTGTRMTLLIGGGRPQNSYVALCTLDGEEVRIGRGVDGLEQLTPVEWDVAEYVGQRMFVRLVDRETGSWGYAAVDDIRAEGRIDHEATAARFQYLRLSSFTAEASELQTRLGPIRDAIDDMLLTYGDRYVGGRAYADQAEQTARILNVRLNLLRISSSEVPLESLQAELVDCRETTERLQQEALKAHPLLREHPIVFVVRPQYRSHYHAIDTLFNSDEFNADRQCDHKDLFEGGGSLKLLRFDEQGQTSTETLWELSDGIIRDPDVHFDAERIVFAARHDRDDDYHIFEINADGSGLTQLTTAPLVADFDPLYLPDDSIVFSSTREPKYNMCSRDIAANLYRMEGDGANIHQITRNTLFENHADLLPDGRIVYHRWEYVDRNFGDAHGLWTVSPDGTGQAVYWGNNTAVPGAVYNPRAIPGTQQMLCTFGPHHDREWGALAIIDRRQGIDGRSAVVRTWPPEFINEVRIGGSFDCDTTMRTVSLKYEDPYPLSDKYFLCSKMIGEGERTGIYLIDLFGNETLLHVEGAGCYDPMPLRPRERPPLIPSRRDFENQDGIFFVENVYEGTHMEGVEQGAVKFLRVVESPEKRHWSAGKWNGQGYTAPGMNWHGLENKRILGVVPVEEDGSAHFSVPSDTFVYFQLLDEDGLMIQSMRSGTVVQSGETTGCVGCHEDRLAAPGQLPKPTPPLALLQGPHSMNGWRGPARDFGFAAEVQPVFDRCCVECHDYGKAAGETLNLAADRGLVFNTAYAELWKKGYVRCPGAGPAEIQPANSWGARVSPLFQELLEPTAVEHADLDLTDEDLDRIATWLDLNGVYYPTYASAYPDSPTGRTPLSGEQFARLGRLTGLNLGGVMSYNRCPGVLVSFDRPELSPCLAGIEDQTSDAYAEALTLIREGQASLAARPRADMSGFVPCEKDQQREEKYAMRHEIEMRNREAILADERYYDVMINVHSNENEQ